MPKDICVTTGTQQVQASYSPARSFSSGFSYAPTTGRVISVPGDPRAGHVHAGIDIANRQGTPVIAVASGVVDGVIQNDLGTCGVEVTIAHDNGLRTVYCHLQIGSVRVSRGQRVSAGQQIGAIGNTGNAKGVPGQNQFHLHFEVKRGHGTHYNPCDFFACSRGSILS